MGNFHGNGSTLGFVVSFSTELRKITTQKLKTKFNSETYKLLTNSD